MSVHPRSKGGYFAKFYVDGKEKRKYFRSLEEAVAYDADLKMAKAKDYPSLMGITTEQLAAEYLKNRPDLCYETKRNITRLLWGSERNGKHIVGPAESLRHKVCDVLTVQDVLALRNHYIEHRNVKATTINKNVALIRSMLEWGAENGLISHNPWRDVKRLKYKKTKISVNPDDIMRVYALLPGYMQWMCETAYALSARPGKAELLSLTWDCINWSDGTATYNQAKTGEPKTVVIPQHWLVKARCRYAEDSSRGIIWICHRNGKRIQSYRWSWDKACSQAGVKPRLYDIRHLAATMMLASGADLSAVSKQLGHSNVVTTGTTYAHITRGAQARAAALQPNIFAPAPTIDVDANTLTQSVTTSATAVPDVVVRRRSVEK